MAQEQALATADATPAPQVLIVGMTGNPADAPELYSPDTGKFTSVPGAPPLALIGHIATLLPDGDVLIAGGQPQTTSAPSSMANLYQPKTGGFSSLGNMTAARAYHTVSAIGGGQFLITGGIGGYMPVPSVCSAALSDPALVLLASAEVFDAKTGIFTPTGNMHSERWGHTATTLLNGKVLITGGQDGIKMVTCGTTTYCGISISKQAELYDPATGLFSPTGDMNVTRYQHAATLLPSGKVLISGGWDNWPISCPSGFGPYTVAASTEIYDPGTGTFSPAPDMEIARLAQASILLHTGKALIAGGFNGTQTALAELYDPETNAFISTGSMTEIRASQSATLLADGRVLMAGGAGNGTLSSAESYDPATGRFASTGSMDIAGGNSGTLLNTVPIIPTPTPSPTAGPTSTPSPVAPVYHGCPQKIDSSALSGPIDDFTEHTYDFGNVSGGSVGDCGITRVFSGPIQSLKVTIVSGEAFDIGYVEGLLVTDATSCGSEGQVTAPVDVTDAVSIVGGNTARLTLRAEEVCPFGDTGWGEDVQDGSPNARLRWHVAIGPPTPTPTASPKPTPAKTTTQTPTPTPTPRAYYDNCPQIIDSSALGTKVDDFTQHSYSFLAGPVGSFADCDVTRIFSGPIKSIKVTIESGTADDIGFVGDLQVTDTNTPCVTEGQVLSPMDVTGEVSVIGNSAKLTLRAEEDCCCVTGWGMDTRIDRPNALLHWQVVVGQPTPTPTPAPTHTRTPRPTPTRMSTQTPRPTPTPSRPPPPTSTPTVVPGTPIISSIPKVLFVGGSFQIIGSGFTTGSVVNLFVATAVGPVKAGTFLPQTPISPTQLTVRIPKTVTLGQGFASVEVVNTDKGFKVSKPAFALLQGLPAAGIPTIKTINDVGLAASSSDPSYATNNVETVVTPGSVVTLGGSGFDIVHGVAVDLFCACPAGKVGPFIFDPGDPGLTPDLLAFVLPADGPNMPLTGPGSFVVSNKGADGTFSKKSNAVAVPIGAQITVKSVTQNGTTITVNGNGFSSLTVLNFFATTVKGVANLGGLTAAGAPKIPLTVKSPDQFTFTKPAGAKPGAAYVQALNPPFLPFTSSGNGPSGAFTLK